MERASRSGRSASARLTKSALAGLAGVLLAGAPSARAAEVTFERLSHPEPQNWLMNHHDFAAHRYSTLDQINRGNVQNLKLAFAVALGAGRSNQENLQATPLIDDGFMYIPDSWGTVYKIDLHANAIGRIVWKMDPGQEKVARNRGVALWGNLVISVAGEDGRVIATDKESGRIVWDKNLHDQPDLLLSAAPLALKDAIVVGASGGDSGVRDWLAALDPKTGDLQWKTYTVPAPGEPGSETWKDKANAWQTGGGAFYVTGSYDPASNLTYWGSGNPVPKYDSGFRPGDNLYTSSALAIDAATGKLKWHFQYTPNDNRDYDETGTHIIIDAKVNGEDRKLLAHPGRNGFYYSFDRTNGQFLKANQYVGKVTWTKGIDPKTGKPVDYDPGKDQQTYAEDSAAIGAARAQSVCPSESGGNNFWPAAFSEQTHLLYVPETEGCVTITPDKAAHVRGNFGGGGYVNDSRLTSGLAMLDPATGEVKKRVELPYPNESGALATAGGIVVTALLDGTLLAFDDQTLAELWRINLGTGINAPPVTFAVDGKQYIAIATGLSGPARGKLSKTPELKNFPQSTMVFVFGL
jgi:alcohol dehydrogenase (cytochrome c)